MNINEAIAILSDPTKDALIIDNAELVGWLKELKEAKQYLGELLTIVNTFGLVDLYQCGQVDNSCHFCKYFDHELNHGLCNGHQPFVWEHSVEAYELIKGDDIRHGQTETTVH